MSDYRDKNDEILQRGVAQSGSAPGLGPGGRRFESCRPDRVEILNNESLHFFMFYFPVLSYFILYIMYKI